MTIPFIPDRMLPKGDYPYPIMPQEWHFRQSIDYSITAGKAILDFAAHRREEILFNRYVMGKNAIDKGNRDNWTFQPQAIAEVQAQVESGTGRGTPRLPGPGRRRNARRRRGAGEILRRLRDPAKRDPRGFIIPADQPDFQTAIKFVNTLIKSGVAGPSGRPSRSPSAERPIPKAPIVVLAAQAFRAHLLTMFEPQDHPNDFAYPGGPPNPPYDSAGWTVAFQMGVVFDRILDGFDGPFEEIHGFAKLPAGSLGAAAGQGRRVPSRPPDQRRRHPDEPAAQSRRGRLSG